MNNLIKRCCLCLNLCSFKCSYCEKCLCERCLVSYITETGLINNFCCRNGLYNPELLRIAIQDKFTKIEKNYIYSIFRLKKECQVILYELDNSGIDINMTNEYIKYFDLSKESIICRNCRYIVNFKSTETRDVLYQKCKCDIEKMYINDYSLHKKLLIYYKCISEIEYYLLKLNRGLKVCRVCDRYHSGSTNIIECCGNFQCYSCGYIICKAGKFSEYLNHSCKDFKYCLRCKRSIMKIDGCNVINCSCGYKFKYSTMLSILDNVSFIDSRNLKLSLDIHKKRMYLMSTEYKVLYILINFFL